MSIHTSLLHFPSVENVRLHLVRRVAEMGMKIFSKSSKVECYPFSQENQGALRYWWEKARKNHSFQWRALVSVSEAVQKGDQVCELIALAPGQKVFLGSSLLLRMGSSKHVVLVVQWEVDLRGLLRESFFFLIPEPRAAAWWGTWCCRPLQHWLGTGTAGGMIVTQACDIVALGKDCSLALQKLWVAKSSWNTWLFLSVPNVWWGP